MSKLNVSLSEIENARHVLSHLFEPTPLLANRWLSERTGCEVYLKLENMHPIGSFKIRGATYKISKLTAAQRRKGVVAASAGNHAQGVAWGCATYKTRATIFMPVTAPLMKVQNTEALGAKVILQGENYDAAYAIAKKFAAKSGQVFVHPYDDEDVIAGQGTTALEILEQLPDVDAVIGSMGGGGMIAGIGTVMKAFKPKTLIVGAQAAGARSLVNSIQKKHAITTGFADTFADGIKVINPSARMVQLLSTVVDHTAVASDEEIAAAVLMLLEKAKVVSEGAGALALAVLEKMKTKLRGKKVVLLITGGNIDVNVLSRIIDRGLIKAGRRVRLNVYIYDRPGSLNRLTQLIADQGANILQAIHDRDAPGAKLNQTMVELTLETRGPEHSSELVSVLKNEVQSIELLN